MSLTRTRTGPLDLELSELTMRTPHLPLSLYSRGENFFKASSVCLFVRSSMKVHIYIRCLGRRRKDDILGGWGGNSTRNF